MKTDQATRPYRMRARADAAAETARDILAATAALWREKALDAFTLQEIAARAGVSVQTVIRRFGSKEGVIDACIEVYGEGVAEERDEAPTGDVAQAVAVLFRHYERDGDAVLRTLALEDRMPAARTITTRGRRAHREWCARVFAPYVSAPDAMDHDRQLDAFVAATDVYLWKLLRRDLARTEEEARQAILILLQGLVHDSLCPPTDTR